jgi:hypothetical protein
MVVQTETSEATNFDSNALCQGAPDGVKDFFHRDFRVLRHQVWEAGCDGGDEFAARQAPHSTVWPWATGDHHI